MVFSWHMVCNLVLRMSEWINDFATWELMLMVSSLPIISLYRNSLVSRIRIICSSGSVNCQFSFRKPCFVEPILIVDAEQQNKLYP
jgi:hypothetical protein